MLFTFMWICGIVYTFKSLILCQQLLIISILLIVCFSPIIIILNLPYSSFSSCLKVSAFDFVQCLLLGHLQSFQFLPPPHLCWVLWLSTINVLCSHLLSQFISFNFRYKSHPFCFACSVIFKVYIFNFHICNVFLSDYSERLLLKEQYIY